MENVIRVIAAGIFVFLLYTLIFIEDSSPYPPFIMIAGASAFVLYLISVKYFDENHD